MQLEIVIADMKHVSTSNTFSLRCELQICADSYTFLLCKGTGSFSLKKLILPKHIFVDSV